MSRPEVTVFGAGIFGLSVAWSCLQRGAQVTVVDPGGVGAGSSGGIVGALAPHTPENWNEKKQFQFESLIMAEAYWREVAKVSGQNPGYGRLGRLQPVLDDHGLELARKREVSARELWQGQAGWFVEHAEGLGDWAPASPTGWVIRDTLSARLHPRQACAALATAIKRQGGVVVTGGAARGFVVEATGYAGLLSLSDDLGRTMGNGVKGQALLLEYAAPERPQLFADALHIIPHADGTVAVGSTSERGWEAPASTDAQLEAVHARAVAAFPVLQGAPVLERWAGVRPRARTRAPLLGRHPMASDRFIANGGFKIGFGMAPKVGEVMADLILGGVDTIPDAFRVETALG
ncbi:NAD(P)/FAD-dependent oxidoreductase [Litoreibacter roseus]|uniref:Oxidoreductase n=1 Tax=Litoreibacter roseus TaxID=2601869 RepID=A0A6N6JGN0_9RHOB|nr:FAD-dependent oxidoreductase [Litoreibacter roseus]GFE64990.1 oxidoreductase [Litoreibacter roseus]